MERNVSSMDASPLQTGIIRDNNMKKHFLSQSGTIMILSFFDDGLYLKIL